MDKKKRIPKQKRDASGDKKKIKKIALVIVSALLALLLLVGVLNLVLELIYPDVETVSYDDFRFFEADYNKNILEDALYLSHSRGINYNRYGDECVLTEGNIANLSETAAFFYDYFNSLVNGDYANHPSFYTQDFLDTDDEKKVFPIPERFTMQGIYDINIKLFSISVDENTPNESTEIFEVSYRIFENNGTFRRDILPDETQTLVYELYISDGVVKINSIAYRTNG